MTVAILAGLLWSLVPGLMAQKKGRSFWAYYFLSLLISPLITMIIVALLSTASKPVDLYDIPPAVDMSADTNADFCEICGAQMPTDSDVCRVCRCKKIAP